MAQAKKRRVSTPKPLREEPQLEPWEQQRGESAPAFEAFACYRDMEPTERSIRKVGQLLAKNRTTLGEWSVRHKWVERVQAWDRKLDEETRHEMLKRHKNALKGGAQWLAAPASVLALAMQQEPLLPSMLAEELVQAAHRGRGLAAFEKLLRMVATGMGGGVVQLISAERMAHGLSSENLAIGAAGDEFSASTEFTAEQDAIFTDALLAAGRLMAESRRTGDGGEQR